MPASQTHYGNMSEAPPKGDRVEVSFAEDIKVFEIESKHHPDHTVAVSMRSRISGMVEVKRSVDDLRSRTSPLPMTVTAEDARRLALELLALVDEQG